jgi:hypothetical protein
VVGGAVGYLRFLRRRLLHASCQLDLTAELGRTTAGTALLITATATNAGSYRLRFPPETAQLVAVSTADRAMWDDAADNDGEILWSQGICYRQELLVTEGARDDGYFLEPGQRLVRSLLVPTLPESALAYYVYLYVEAAPQLIRSLRPVQNWSTELTLVEEETHGG